MLQTRLFQKYLKRLDVLKRNKTYPRIMTAQQDTKLAIVRNQELNRIAFSLVVQPPGLGVDKQINMCREGHEDMSGFVARFSATLTKIIDKGNKKKAKKAKTEVEPIGDGSKVAFLLDGTEADFKGQQVCDFLTQSGLKVAVIGTEYDVRVDPPMIVKGKFSDTLMSRCPFYPYRLEYECADPNETLFEWYVSQRHMPDEKASELQWTKRHEGFVFHPTEDDEHRYVKVICKPSKEGKRGLDYEIVSSGTVAVGPQDCPFEQRHAFRPTGSTSEFRILTYNILADLYADSDFSRTVLFPQCPPYALDISYRKLLIVKELMGYKADILCLEEVDKKVFEHDLLPVLSRAKYDGLFCLKGGQVSEGLACLWQTAKFKLISSTRFLIADSIFKDKRFDYLAKVANDKLKESLTGKTTALKVIVLQSEVNPTQRLIVGITHLYFKPDADHIRLIQTEVCLGHLYDILNKVQSEEPSYNYSVILAGDFNSTPPFGVLEYIRKGQIGENHADWSSCEGEHVKGLSIKNPFKMDSACGTPEYTNYTQGFNGCLDYIFFDTDKLEVKSVVPFPLNEEVEQTQGLPNINFPSDHLACVADLAWKK